MTQAEARQDRDGQWHIAKPAKKSCETGHKLRESDSGYDVMRAEGVTEIRRAISGRKHHGGDEERCRECNW